MDLDTLDLDLSGDYPGDYSGDDAYGRSGSGPRGRQAIFLKIRHNQMLIKKRSKLRTKTAKASVKKLRAQNTRLIALLHKSRKHAGGAVHQRPVRGGGRRRRSSSFQPSAHSGGEASDEQVLSTEEPVLDESLETEEDAEENYGSSALTRLRAKHKRENVALVLGSAALGPAGIAVALATQKKRRSLQHKQVTKLKEKIEKRKTQKAKSRTRRRHALEAQIAAARTLMDIRKCRLMLRQALDKEYILPSTGARLLSKLRERSKKILQRSGYTSLSSAQKVKLLQIFRLLRAGRISKTQAEALAVQVAPNTKDSWTEHAALAAEEPTVAAAATAASPSTATPSEAAAASVVTDTTAASAGSGFTASTPATVSAVYSASTPPPATTSTDAVGSGAPTTTSTNSTAPVVLPEQTVLPEDAVDMEEASEEEDLEAEEEDLDAEEAPKSNLKTYGLVVLAGLGVWYLFLRPSSTTVVVK